MSVMETPTPANFSEMFALPDVPQYGRGWTLCHHVVVGDSSNWSAGLGCWKFVDNESLDVPNSCRESTAKFMSAKLTLSGMTGAEHEKFGGKDCDCMAK